MDEPLKEQLLYVSKIILTFVLGSMIIDVVLNDSVRVVMNRLQMSDNLMDSGFSGATWTCNKYLPELWNCSGNLMTSSAMADNNVQCDTLTKAQNYTCFEYVLLKRATAEQIAMSNPELTKKSSGVDASNATI